MGFTNQGLNHVLDVAYHGATQVTTWYIGLINNSPGPTLAAGDTLASHAGWAELVPGTDYTGNRLAWGNGAASGQASTNSSFVNFPILTTQTIYGLLLASVATGTSGTLMLTAAFVGGPQGVSAADVLQVTNTIAASG